MNYKTNKYHQVWLWGEGMNAHSNSNIIFRITIKSKKQNEHFYKIKETEKKN